MIDPIKVLSQLIAIPSFSTQEDATADYLVDLLTTQGFSPERYGNNVVARHQAAADDAPWILFNSHHDTVRPGPTWTRHPYDPTIVDGRLYGLGSNDAGGALVTMLCAFLALAKHDTLPANIMFAATAEEEISGNDGMAMLVRMGIVENITLALVGEPTGMHPAIAERGLIVLDCTAQGVSGHAARREGSNAIYKAIDDINWFQTYHFDRVSPTLGTVGMTVTQIEAGTQHNVVPDECRFVVDVRVTDQYTNEEVLEIITRNVAADVQPRSLRLRSSAIAADHPLVRVFLDKGRRPYGSPTMSDQSLLPAINKLKVGPGDSARSHTADEWIGVDEVCEAIPLLTSIMEQYLGVQS
jgi:acetylornithine deacetylase